MKGKKSCSNCKKIVGARTKICGCGHVFYGKREKIDWTTLRKGDIIIVKRKSGPFRILDNGKKVFTGHFGKFVVHSADNSGLHVHSRSNHSYIYMGDDYISKSGTNMRAHVIEKVYNKS